MTKTFHSKNPADTFKLGRSLGAHLAPPAFLGLIGPLGSGKTLLVKGIARSMGHDELEVHSPSFTIMNIYEGPRRLYHFDFFRLESPKDFDSLGLEEFFHARDAVVVVEWAEKVRHLIPEEALMIQLEYGKGENDREITIRSQGTRMKELLPT